ncbi:MAG TPA: lipopolysaccharide biosynthesis protein [Pirellulales bacterium]|nr:lipopolysaccharide biosynthesis protein [Pirellulales bacterium]
MNPAEPEQAQPVGFRTDSLAESVMLLLGMALLQRVVGFVRGIFFCGWLAPEQLGEWDMAYGFFLMAAPVAVLGLPGSFGRYLEYYRQQGQLRTILRRTGRTCTILGVAAMIVVGCFGPWFSQLIFGRPDRAEVVVLIGVVLLLVIAYNFLTEMLTALRMFRMVSVLQFLNSMAFAGLGVALLVSWHHDVTSVVVAFGGASLVGGVVGLLWLRQAWKALPLDTKPLPHGQLWVKLLPYAGWMWICNLLYNLFEVADRYMLIHYSKYNQHDALVAVGNYHSSRIIPLLLLTVATMLGAMITPHLSHDWEAGRHEAVARRLNLTLKMLGFALYAASVLILLGAPFLFGVLLHGKYQGGLTALPWTLAYCSWLGLAVVAQNYLLCAECAWLSSAAFLGGLLLNVALNLWWVPQHGLIGAVWATAVAKLTAMALILICNQRLGMAYDRGVWSLALLPIALGGGPLLAVVVLVAAVVVIVRSETIFSKPEKMELRRVLGHFVRKLGIRLEPAPAALEAQPAPGNSAS